MKNKISFLSVIFGLITFTNIINAQWEQVIMPGSRGGAVYSICFKDSLMFAGIKGGVYVSSDKGEHWKKVNPDLPPREYDAIVFSLAFAGEKLVAAFNEPGVYVSSDEGSNWFKANINENLRLTPYIIAANKNLIIGGNVFLPGKTYKSYDKGITWEVDTLSCINALAVKDSFIIAQSHEPDKQGIYLSTNYGLTWSNVHPFYYNYITWWSAFAISDSLVFAGAIGNWGSNILLSTDRGFTWNDRANLNCTAIYSLIFSPEENNNHLFAGTDSGAYRSSDNGINWVPINNGLGSKHIFSLVFKPNKPKGIPILYAGTGDGIYCSSDNGDSWNVIGSPSEWIFVSSGSDIFAASSNEEYPTYNDEYKTVVYHSTDQGNSWTETFSGDLFNKSKIVSWDASSNEEGNIILYAIIEQFTIDINPEIYNNIIMSDDFGISWEIIYSDTTDRFSKIKTKSPGFLIVSSYLFTGIYYNHLRSILLSTDYGNIWSIVDTGNTFTTFSFDGNKIYAAGSKIDATVISPRNIVLKMVNSIIVSEDMGLNWIKVKSPLDSATVINNASTDTLSVILDTYAKGSHLIVSMRANNFYEPPYSVPSAFGGGLFHLIHKWDIADSSFTGHSIFAVESNYNDIYTATDTGVFRSTDFGSTWNDISSGMKNIYVSSLFKSDDYLFANTINGTWKRPLSEITSVLGDKKGGEIPNQFGLSQNYPNPFNPTTNIEFRIANFGSVTLKIYDILGRELTTLVNEEKPAGTYKINFNASELSSGVYFYQLRTGNFSETKKLILMK